MIGRPHPDSIVWDLPGPPYHPADLMLAKIHHENRMREIREMDIEAWVSDILEVNKALQ